MLDKKVPLLNMTELGKPLPPLPQGWPMWSWVALLAVGVVVVGAILFYWRRQRLQPPS